MSFKPTPFEEKERRRFIGLSDSDTEMSQGRVMSAVIHILSEGKIYPAESLHETLVNEPDFTRLVYLIKDFIEERKLRTDLELNQLSAILENEALVGTSRASEIKELLEAVTKKVP